MRRVSLCIHVIPAVVIAVFLCAIFSVKTMAAEFDQLNAKEKNSSYGFFVWLSENADKAEDRKDAEAAAQILKNSVNESYQSEVMNDGHIIGGTTSKSYQDLINATHLGEENDATSLECLRDSIQFVTLGNQYRAKENLAPLKISSALMAMAELDVNILDIDTLFDHTGHFNALENLAWRVLGGTWKYGAVGGGKSDDPFEGWYTDEKKIFDTGNHNLDDTGHYQTLTDRQGKMLITGMGVCHRYVPKKITATNGKLYDAVMHDKYYSQEFSNRDDMYNLGNGFTPDEYLKYLDRYQCEAVGHQLTETKGIDATCTEKGSIPYYSCEICGKKFSDKEGKNEVANISLPAKGHQWNKTYTTDQEATCSKEGRESIHCGICNAIRKGSERAIDKTAHEYGDWSVTKEAGCEDAGNRQRKCRHCDDLVTEDIPAKGHQWKETYTTDQEATCISEGSESIHCSNCDAVKKGSERAIDKIAHVFGKWETVDQATYENTGLKRRRCTHCDAFEEEEIPILIKEEEEKPAKPDPKTSPEGDKTGNQTQPRTITTDTAPNKPGTKQAVEKVITRQKSDADPKGSSFGLLSAKGKAKSKKSIRVSWNRVKGATAYLIYGNLCGRGRPFKKIRQTSGTSFTQAKLKKGTYYKYLVVAVNGSKVIAISKTVHVATKGGKVGNNKKVTTKAKKNKVTLKKGKRFKLKAKAIPQKKKLKVKKHHGIMYETSNKKIAIVGGNGVIRAMGKGSCYVYAYAQDGVYARVRVTVK